MKTFIQICVFIVIGVIVFGATWLLGAWMGYSIGGDEDNTGSWVWAALVATMSIFINLIQAGLL